MTEPIPPNPVDPARVQAVLEVMGWPDDRTDPDCAPVGFYWQLAEEIIRAADSASSESHIIAFRPGGWTLQHPLSCRPNLFACPVNQVAEASLDGPVCPPGRYECSVNDIGDRLLIGDRVDQDDDGCTCPMVDVTSLGDLPDTRRALGLDPSCPLHTSQHAGGESR